MNVEKSKLIKSLIVVVDICLIHLAFIFAFLLRFGINIPYRNLNSYLEISATMTILAFILFYLFDFYSNYRNKSSSQMISSAVLMAVTFTITTMALTFFLREFALPRSVLAISLVLNILMLTLRNFVLNGLFIWKFGQQRTLIIGKNTIEISNIQNLIESKMKQWFRVDTICSEKEWRDQISPSIEAVFLLQDIDKEEKSRIIEYCVLNKIEVLIMPSLDELILPQAEILLIQDKLTLSIAPLKISRMHNFIKRIFDVVLSCSLLIVFIPLFITLCICIPLFSKGPVFYLQERLGLQGKPFKVLKFRTMIIDAEEHTGPVLSSEDDPRITFLGFYLKKYRLDEIPQLLNVLKGEMSIVGPRPERPFFIKQFEAHVPNYRQRMIIKPGITGFAQVKGSYYSAPEDKLRFDIWYIRNYSLLLDIKILIMTFLKVITELFQLKPHNEKKTDYNLKK